MTLTEIQFDKPPTKRHAIFIAAGDKETFASYALQNLAAYFDILIFFYGDDAKVRAGLERNARFLAVGSATKFNALKSLDAASGIVARYRTIWVCFERRADVRNRRYRQEIRPSVRPLENSQRILVGA